MQVGPDLGARARPPQAAHDLDVVVLGVHEHLLTAAAPPGSFPLHTLAPYVAGRALARGRRLDEEVEEVLRGLHCPQHTVVGAASETMQQNLRRR